MQAIRPAEIVAGAQHAEIGGIVRKGLSAAKKSLPPHLFYDEAGSALFEQITDLPEYYPTRTERSIFARHGDAIMAEAARLAGDHAAVLELGAGSASKTQLLLRALARRQGRTSFLPADVSASALDAAAERLRREEPELSLHPLVATHGEALARARSWDGALIVLFIGSSIGNYDDVEAQALLRDVRETLGAREARDARGPGGGHAGRGALVLGTDLRKPLDVLLPAYDDARGVTAAFNLNVLGRINRELGGRFDLARFRHVALWNDEASAIEMHLESVCDQRVAIDALDLEVTFRAGERIHTESSHKYDEARVDALLHAAGLARTRSFVDERRWFGVHVARPV
jgi:dimethylhistidine N-methyltransferase